MMRRAPSTPPELPGHTFVRVLGSGGFSDVFLYEQKLPKRRVAVKVLLTEELSTSTRASFVAEANLMAQLSAHPYIVTIFHADVAADDRPYFVMEYCSGPSLAESYKQATMSVPDALRTGVRLSSAIATAHAAGILHRDIKPANVLTNDYGWPALTDFGISSSVDDDLLPVHTGTLASALAEQTGGTASTSVGMSVPWSPPEMFEDDPQPDIRSDVFALAATIHTVLAGRTPFEVRGRSNGTLDLIGRIERGAITPLDRDDVPRSLVAVLRKGMATDRADRFATAVDFARALQRVELELGYSPTTIDVPNLLLATPDRADAGGDDETRVRSIATIDAQPVNVQPVSAPPRSPRAAAPRIGPAPAAVTPPASSPPGPPLGPPPGDDETVVRPPVRIDAQPNTDAGDRTVVRSRPGADVAPAASAVLTDTPPADAPPVADPAVADPAARRNRLVVLVAGAAAAAVAIAVTVGLVASGGAPGSDPDPTASPTGGSAISEGVPTPTLTSKTPEAGQVVFTVANPEPVEGDVFRWRISNFADDEPFSASTDGRIAVPDPGQSICVQVFIVRDGQESSNPLDECYP